MKKIKNTTKKNNKNTKNEIQEQEISIKKILTTSLILLVIFFAFYGITVGVLNLKNNGDKEYNGINSSSRDILASNLLKQKEDLYYVIAINDNYKDVYNLYTKKMDSFYNIDLKNALNKNIIGDKTDITEDPRDIKINDTVLFVIENKQIKEYFVGKEEVVNKLKTIAF